MSLAAQCRLLAVARSRNAWPHAEHRTDAGEGMHCNYMHGLQVKKQIYSLFFSVGGYFWW